MMLKRRATTGGTQRALAVPSVLLGFAAGGFFDGILLHQVLQWHHLLSAVAPDDLRLQVLADGVFHLAMYVVAIVGALMLVRRRACLAEQQASRRLWAWAATGFGGWHTLDAVFSHGLLGLHRVRMDSPMPLAWDLGWWAVFGLLPFAAGLRSLQQSRPRARRGMDSAFALILGVGLAGALSLIASDADAASLVVFAPGISAAQAFDQLAAVDARPLWSDRSGGVWLVRAGPNGRLARLYLLGALWVAPSGALAGCIGASRPS